MKNKKIWLAFGTIILLALVIRFYNFSNRINFSAEEGIALSVSSGYLKQFSFLGVPNVQRATATGHTLFAGAEFYYTLVPLILLFKGNPLPITAFFTFLNVFTGAVLFFVVKRFWKLKVAFLTLFLFLFNSYMINHSLYIWNLHYLPLIGVLSILFLMQKSSLKRTFWLGLLSGIGFNLEFFYLFTAGLVFLILFVQTNKKILTFLVFSLSAAIGTFSILAFDLRHNGYHMWTLWNYFIDTLHKPGQNKITFYHFLQFWPLLALAGGLILSRFKTWLVTIILVGYILYNLTNAEVDFDYSVDMPKGLVYADMDKAAQLIASQATQPYNIVFYPDQDFRAHAIRYLLTDIYHSYPEGIETYQSVNELYVVADRGQVFGNGDAWEVEVFGPVATEKITDLGKNSALFKLTK